MGGLNPVSIFGVTPDTCPSLSIFADSVTEPLAFFGSFLRPAWKQSLNLGRRPVMTWSGERTFGVETSVETVVSEVVTGGGAASGASTGGAGAADAVAGAVADGDGAGAALLVRSETPGLLASAYRADGAYAKHWGIYAGGTAEPASHEAIDAGRTTVRMVDKYPAEINDEGWPAIVKSLARNNRFGLEDIDLVIFTQVRKRTIVKVMGTLGLPMEKTHTIMEKWGYTGSACIPMALHDAVTSGKVETGDLVVLVGSGVGHNQAGIAIRITDDLVRKGV